MKRNFFNYIGMFPDIKEKLLDAKIKCDICQQEITLWIATPLRTLHGPKIYCPICACEEFDGFALRADTQKIHLGIRKKNLKERKEQSKKMLCEAIKHTCTKCKTCGNNKKMCTPEKCPIKWALEKTETREESKYDLG